MHPVILSTLAGLALSAAAVAQTPASPRAGIEFLHDYSQKRRFQQHTVESLRAATDAVMRQHLAALLDEVRADAARRTDMLSRSRFEVIGEDLAHLAVLAGDDEAARRSVAILEALAQDADKLAEPAEYEFHWWSKAVPAHAVLAYAMLKDREPSPFSAEGRIAVERWLSRSARLVTDRGQDLALTNITPYGLSHAVGVAVTLNDPDLIRAVIRVIDRLYTGEYFHADAMWYEGALAYHAQTIGNLDAALWQIERLWSDPAGYSDAILNLSLNKTNLRSRWPLLAKAQRVLKTTVYPDGRRLPIGDTYGEKPRAISDANLHNIELWHYGLFSLTHGDATDATQVTLQFSPQSLGTPFGGGHRHGDRLGITLFAAGDDLLPDAGYAFKPANHRYFHMHPAAHNVPWVWSSKHNYKAIAGLWNRPALLAYDDGRVSGGRVQLVEASVPGPAAMNIAMRRRLILLIAAGDNRAYTVDVSHLRGGEAHQWFLRQSENEDCELSVVLPLLAHEGTLKDYLTSTGRTSGLGDYRELMREPRIGEGASAFDFAWTGKDSGSTLHAFVNGIAGSEVFFSRTPRLRPTHQDPAKRDDFPGWHLERRHIVDDPAQTTRFAAVYDAARRDQQPLVRSVEWAESEQTLGIQIVLADGQTDQITVRLHEEQASSVEVIRSGKWRYLLGETVMERPIEAVHRKLAGHDADAIVIRGSIPDEAVGRWLTIVLGDGSARGMRVEGITASEGGTCIIDVHDDPGMEVTSADVRQFSYPHRKPSRGSEDAVTPGPARIRLAIPRWTSVDR